MELLSGAEQEIIRAEREVIISSGAIGLPKLLLQSGVGPADELMQAGVKPVHDLAGVGKNLHDHLDLFVICECSGPHSYDSYARLDKTAWAGLQYLLFRNGPAASSLFETGAFWYSDPSIPLPDLQFHFGLGSGIEAGVAKMPMGGVTLNAAYMRPKSRGTVKLRSSDPTDTPLIDPNYWQDSGHCILEPRPCRRRDEQHASSRNSAIETVQGPSREAVQGDTYFAPPLVQP